MSLVFRPVADAIAPPGWGSAGHAFTLDAYRDGVGLPGLEFETPVTVTIVYTESDLVGLDESSLEMWYWDGSHWSGEGITALGQDPLGNTFTAELTHLSEFALFAKRLWFVYLPAVLRGH
jgi:hypothetical protein